MAKKKHFVLKKTAKYAFCTVLAISCINYASMKYEAEIPYTEEDIKNNKIYVTELANIEHSTPEFKNKDLYNELINQGISLDLDNFKNIKALKITKHFLNNDFSDLKYFPNLSQLIIENNEVDLNDLKYNYNLLDLNINNCEISNTESLPNSIYNLTLSYTKVKDSLVVPYNTKYLHLRSTPTYNIILKNPENLKRFNIYGNAFIDISFIEDCKNLEIITLERIANVKNSTLLTTLPSLNRIHLDDYSPIWLDKDTYNLLPVDNKEILNEIIKLDEIASTLFTELNTDEEKIESITRYILERLTYDYDFTDELSTKYNTYPIKSLLNDNEVVCINYACLFTALANRAGLDTYQIFNHNHTWNMISTDDGESFIDLTKLDDATYVKIDTERGPYIEEIEGVHSLDYFDNNEEDKLHYYNFSFTELLQDSELSRYTGLPLKTTRTIKNIGYVNTDKKGIPIEIRNKFYYLGFESIYKMIIGAATTLLALSLINNKDEQKKLK